MNFKYIYIIIMMVLSLLNSGCISWDLASLEYGTLETTTITIDGDNSDWKNVRNKITDPANDQTGNSSTDITKFSAVISGTNMALLMETSGPIAMPHTPGQDSSGYGVSINFFTNTDCYNSGSEFGWVSVEIRADNLGNVLYDSQYFTPPNTTPSGLFYPTKAAYAGNVLEMEVSLTAIPSNAKSIGFWPRTDSYLAPQGATQYDDMNNVNIGNYCFKLP
ncbi:MAG: hypothetical protein OEV66_02805 [Spirochaetia bacterium]|nr:hypothetical protein [Spirochaetia bacterium]